QHDPTGPGPADDHGLAAQHGTAEQFHGRVEGVHVDMQDGAGGIVPGGRERHLARRTPAHGSSVPSLHCPGWNATTSAVSSMTPPAWYPHRATGGTHWHGQGPCGPRDPTCPWARWDPRPDP